MKLQNEEIFFADYHSDSSKKILYAPLRATALLVDANLPLSIQKEEPNSSTIELIEYLQSKPLVNIQNVLEEQQNEVPELSISLTNDCNLKCIYCHANAGSIDKESTNNDKIDFILEKYFELFKDKFSSEIPIALGFMGSGEPFHKFNLLKYTVAKCRSYCTQMGLKLEIATATNGFFNKNVADYILENFTHLSLSFDGPDFIQNYHRPLNNGGKTFDTVFANAKYFYQNNLSISFRATISTISIKHYKDLIDFFVTNFPNCYLGLEPLSKFGRGKDSEIAPTKEEYYEFMQKANEYALNKPIIFKNSMIENLYYLKTVFCKGVSSPNFTINPNGDLWACARENAPDVFQYGKFDFEKRELLFDEFKMEQLKALNVFKYPECQDCLAKYHCAGDCPDYRLENLTRCNTTLMLTTNMLNELINN